MRHVLLPLFLAFAIAWPFGTAPADAASAADAFLDSLLAPVPGQGRQAPGLLVRSYANSQSVSSYDAALASLWLLERGRRDEAGRLLAGLAALQAPGGAIAFSFPLPAPDPRHPYHRAGAMAWVGYAAAHYMNTGASGPERPAIARMAHQLAAYLLARRVTAAGDPREGLITGGSGRYQYGVGKTGVLETLVPGELHWVSTEHNVDSYFFLHELARATHTPRYAQLADDIGRALVEKLWSNAAGQFYQGAGDALDRTLALDCASWGALFLLAAGHPTLAERAYQTAEARFAAADPVSGASGHRPYAGRPLLENRAIASYFNAQVPVNDWDQVPAVWPEGSAGVALAAWRLGHRARARALLESLETLRTAGGGLPCLTREIPLEFAHDPALAGTAWVALVRAEMARGHGAIWAQASP